MSRFTSPSYALHMWPAAHFNTADHILSDLRSFPNTAAIKNPGLGCKKKAFVVPPNEMLSCNSEDNTGIYMPRFLESSLRSVGWGLRRGWPTSLSCPDLTPLPLSNSSRRQMLKARLSFHEKNFCDLYRVYFLLLIFYYFFPYLFGIDQHPAPLRLLSLSLSSTPLLGRGLFQNQGRTHLRGAAWFSIINVNTHKQNMYYTIKNVNSGFLWEITVKCFTCVPF